MVSDDIAGMLKADLLVRGLTSVAGYSQKLNYLRGRSLGWWLWSAADEHEHCRNAVRLKASCI
jgi:hypothetical protein